MPSLSDHRHDPSEHELYYQNDDVDVAQASALTQRLTEKSSSHHNLT